MLLSTAGGCEQDGERDDHLPANDAGAGGENDAGHAGAGARLGEGGAGEGGMGGSGTRPGGSCKEGPFTINACKGPFQAQRPCAQTVQQALDVSCAARPLPWAVSRSRSECGQTVVVVEYGWGAESFYFDADGQPVGYDYGTDQPGDCATYGAACLEQVEERVVICGDDELPSGAAGAGGQGGAGGQAGAAGAGGA